MGGILFEPPGSLGAARSSRPPRSRCPHLTSALVFSTAACVRPNTPNAARLALRLPVGMPGLSPHARGGGHGRRSREKVGVGIFNVSSSSSSSEKLSSFCGDREEPRMWAFVGVVSSALGACRACGGRRGCSATAPHGPFWTRMKINDQRTNERPETKYRASSTATCTFG